MFSSKFYKKNKYKYMKKKIIYILTILVISACGNDFLNVSPSTNANEETVIQSVSDLKIATQGAYETLTSSAYYQGEYTFIADLMGDHMMEPTWGSKHLSFYYEYGFSKVRAETDIFRNIYLGMQNINIILKKAESLKESSERLALTSELRVIRALLHFDLVRMYGPLYSNLGKGTIKADALGIRIAKEPIVNMRDYFYRDKVSAVYDFIQKELEESVPNLPKAKRKGYIDYWAGTAILAKVYLYMEKNDKALASATEVIEKSGLKLYDMDNYEKSWGEEFGSESILELATSLSDNSGYNSLGWMCSEKGYKTVVPTSDFLKLKEADSKDVRFSLLKYSKKDNCYYISGKYPGREGNVKINNPKVLRLSEIYLIAAESALKLNDVSKAGDYLSDLREKRTELEPRKYDKAVTINDVLYERAIELYGEGNRVWDMWRNQKSVVRYTSLVEKEAKGHSDLLTDGVIKFDFYQTIYPIAERELELLPVGDRGIQQNPGY